MAQNPLFALDPDVYLAVQEGIETLTPREISVLTHVLTGLSAKEIGFALGVPQFWVHAVIRSIRKRLGVQTTIEAAAYIAVIEADERKRRNMVTGTGKVRQVP